MASDAWQSLVPFATVVSAIATACAFVVGAISLGLIARQTREASRTAQRATAFDAHKEYLRFCIEHPELSSSALMLRYIGRTSFAGILELGTKETERALWFVSYTLFAMEQLAMSLCTGPAADPAWESTIVDQLGYHAALLVEVWPAWRDHYGSDLGRMVDKAIGAPDPLSMTPATQV